MTATIDVLRADPLKFLRVFPVYLSGQKTSDTKQVHYGKKGNFLRFDCFFPNVDPGVQAEKEKMHVVAAKHGDPDFYTLGADAKVMITSQLSGCCMVRDGIDVAHVWPHFGDQCQCGDKGKPVESGLEIQQNLRHSQPGAKLYGKADYGNNTAYVIGVNNGGWQFYAQEQGPGGGIIRAMQVLL